MIPSTVLRRARQQQISATLDQLQAIYGRADAETERELERALVQARDYVLAWIEANRRSGAGGAS